MKINSIFAVVDGALLAVQYEGEEEHELGRLFELWQDTEYLFDFFELHKKDLQSSFYQEKIGLVSVEEAVIKTLEEAERFEELLLEAANTGKTDEFETLHDLVFEPLHQNDPAIRHLESKAYGPNQYSWLRLYAIRIAPNLYVISGGAIKLTEAMQDREHTNDELKKLQLTAAYLKDIGLNEADDYGYIDINV